MRGLTNFLSDIAAFDNHNDDPGHLYIIVKFLPGKWGGRDPSIHSMGIIRTTEGLFSVIIIMAT